MVQIARLALLLGTTTDSLRSLGMTAARTARAKRIDLNFSAARVELY